MSFDTQYGNFSDPSMVNAASQYANSQADAAYKQALASGANDQQALAWAKFQWQKKLDEASQTGMWNGQWNNPQEQWFTSQFGQWYGAGGAPQAGDQTLQGQQQQYNQAYQNSQLYGQYYAPGTTPLTGTPTQQVQQAAASQAATNAGLTGYLQGSGTGNLAMDAFNTRADAATRQQYLDTSGGDQAMAASRFLNDLQGSVKSAAEQQGRQYTPADMNAYIYGQGQQTLAGNEQGFTQNLRTQQEARAAQAQQQSQTQSYLQLLSQMRGPQNYFQYQNVLGSTPGGMRDLYAAAMGQYVPGGGATTGVQPQAQSLQGLMGDVSGQGYTGQGGGQLGQPNVYQGGQGSYGGQQPQQTWGSGIGIGQQQATPQQQQQGMGNGTNLPAPNQISAQSWKNMAPSQQQLLMSNYEAQGWNKDDVAGLMNQALPKYATNRPTAGTFRLQ